MEFIISKKKGKRYNLQYQKKKKIGIPSDEEKNITHLKKF